MTKRAFRHSSSQVPRGARGFTLFETVFVIVLLALVAAVIKGMQPRIFETQTNGRDQYVGLELARGCAERLLAVRRRLGYGNVTTTTCNGMGGLGSFGANPTVALKGSDNSVLTACSTATCTATISVAKTSGPAASLAAITLQLSAY